MAKLDALVKQVQACRLCPLCRSRHNAVPGEGNESATVMLIGEGPGYHEDREGRPFIGPAGQFLDELLALAGLRRAEVYITNVVKCRPPNNRDPLPPEIDACAPYLERQIATINPRVIVTLGRYSMAKFVTETSISRIHGKAWQQDGRLIVTMYHPAAGLHNKQLQDVIREDFRTLPRFIAQAEHGLPVDAAPAVPPPDPAALLDAYAALVAPVVTPESNGHAPEEALAAPSAAPIAVEEVVAAPPVEAETVVPEPPIEAAPEPVSVADLPIPVVAEVAAEPLPVAPAPRRGRPRKPATLEPAPAPAAAVEPDLPILPGEPATRTPAAITPAPLPPVEPGAATAEGVAAMEAAVPANETLGLPVEPEAPSPPPAAPPDAPPTLASGRKKKAAPEAEQLSLF